MTFREGNISEKGLSELGGALAKLAELRDLELNFSRLNTLRYEYDRYGLCVGIRRLILRGCSRC